MKVSLIDYTGNGNPDPDHAINLLIFTKSTRLKMTPGLMTDIAAMSHWDKLKELEYMANTIPSSWEFVDYTFMIEDVTRAYTHQQVRTRTASFAQQTMRILDVSEGPGWNYLTGPSVYEHEDALAIYQDTMATIGQAYKDLITAGARIEDARGILPTNILTNIVMKINMRNWVDLIRKRSSSRVQGEYRDVLEGMKKAVREVHPWIDLFIERTFDKAAADLEEKLLQLLPEGKDRTDCIKLLDQMRTGQ